MAQQQVTLFDGKKAPMPDDFGTKGEFFDVAFTIGAEGSNVINVSIQVRDFTGAAVAVRCSFYCYLSDDAEGDDLTGTVVTTETAIGTNGLFDIVTTKKSYMLTTESNGIVDVDITQTAAQNYYLIIVRPNGSIQASAVIAHQG